MMCQISIDPKIRTCLLEYAQEKHNSLKKHETEYIVVLQIK